MAWKILTSLTAVCLAAIATFSYLNLNELNAERQLLEYADANRKATIERRQAGQAKLQVTKDEIDATRTELSDRQTDLANTNRQNSDKEADIARLTGQLQAAQARAARFEEQIREFGSVDEVIATAQGLESGIQESEATIASRQQTLAIATNRLADLTSTIRNYQELEGRQRSGRLTDDFQARIASVVPTWGFVILDRGNLAGAYTNATLDVRRGDETVGKLRIGNVEQQVAFADVLPGTFAEGDTPRQGDLVVPAAAAADMAPDAQGGFGLPDMQQPVPVPGIPDMPAGEFGDPGAPPAADGDSVWDLPGEPDAGPPMPADDADFGEGEPDIVIDLGDLSEMSEDDEIVIDLGDLTEPMMEEDAPEMMEEGAPGAGF